jgi:hypothetical protein
MFGAVWLGLYHWRLKTSVLTGAVRVDSLPLGPPFQIGCGGGWRGSSVSFDNTVPLDNVVPTRTKCLLFRSWHRWSRLRCVQASGNTIPSAAVKFCSLFSGRLFFFPLTATTIVSSVISSAATALQLLLWGDTLTGWVNIPASHTPRCIAAVTLLVSESLVAFAMQRPFRSVVRLYFYSQTAELGEISHCCNIGAPRHGHNEVRCKGTVVLNVLVPSPRSELHDSLHMDAQCPQLPLDQGFRHAPALIFQQQAHASVLRE